MERTYKFDRGDWIALLVHGEWKLVGKVVDADSESITVDKHGVRYHYVVGEDPIARVKWRGRTWTV